MCTIFPGSCRVTTETAAETSGQFGRELEWTVKQSSSRKLGDNIHNPINHIYGSVWKSLERQNGVSSHKIAEWIATNG